MNQKWLKYTFNIFSALILAAMLITSKDAGISGDEEVHYKQSEMVYQYFATAGKDQSSLHTPVTHLKYYGQAYDNLTTIFIHWFNIQDIYGFRHLMSSLAGWLTILVTGLLAVFLGGYGAGILTLVLFAISPTFLGHAHNNLKDIPFALAYISTIYLIAKVFFSELKTTAMSRVFLILCIGLAIGIRPGGLLVIFYLWFFVLLNLAYQQWLKRKTNWLSFKLIFLQLAVISAVGYGVGLLLWPYALQNPLVNVWKSYTVMTNFPTTIRQIFEGSFVWSDLLPWYYLPKMMLITIPLAVWAGAVCFVVFSWKNIQSRWLVLYSLILFALLFPPLFAIIKGSNLYGSWRHFLFIYPVLVLLAALGLNYLFSLSHNIYLKAIVAIAIVLLAVHPFRFMVQNHPYYYLYYNQMVGGLQNAYGNYETDYYYHSVREAVGWLIQYLEKNEIENAVIGSNFMISWHLRNHPGLKPVYFSWDKRSEKDWDYAVVTNSYFHPYLLKNGIWPPKHAIHSVYVDNIPVCTVIKRPTKADREGINLYRTGNTDEAIKKLMEANSIFSENEVVHYYLAKAFQRKGDIAASDSVLRKSLEVHPYYELTLYELGKSAEFKGNASEAAGYYDRLIAANPKFYRPYVLRAKLFSQDEVEQARELLKSCIRINHRYVPALTALADTYRASDPEMAEKYDKMAKSIR